MSNFIAPMLTVRQVASLFQVQPATIYAWIRDGEMPHIRLGGRIRIPSAKLSEDFGIDRGSIEAVVEMYEEASRYWGDNYRG